MPWVIEKHDGKFCTMKQDVPGGPGVGDPLHCFDTFAEARDQQKALYASEHDSIAAAAPIPPAALAETPTPSAVSADGPVAAGVALCAMDSGRCLFIQRALIDGELAGGLWEIPGGMMDPGETPWEAAQREFSEETGHPLPAGELAGTWLSPNGVYQGFCFCIESEADFPMDQTDPANRVVDNPDNPQGENYTESMAWMDPAHLDRGPRLLRPEMRAGTPWGMLKNPPIGQMEEAMVATGKQTVEVTVVPNLDWSLIRRLDERAKARGINDLLTDDVRSLIASADETLDFDALTASLVAPASALLPEEPLSGPTPYTVNDDGTADGHLALWASCHIGYPGCVKPPQEDSFDFYNLGDAVTADGIHVPVGRVTVGCGHAGAELSWRTAAAHYDNSGTVAAVAHATADRWGIRLASVLATEDGKQIDELRRSPLSGDWRRINGRLRLVASLGVNVPGYPVPRALVAAGDVQSMFVGFDPSDAAALVLEADSLAASLGLDHASRAASIRASLGLPA